MEDGTSPLMIACQINSIECIKCLVDNGADCNLMTSDFIGILHFCAEFCDLEVIELLINKSNLDFKRYPDFTNLDDRLMLEMKNPLHLAISASNIEMIKYFIENEIFSPNSMMPIQNDNKIYYAKSNTNELFYSALGFALSIGSDQNLIDYLLSSGGSLDLFSDRILHPILCSK